MKGDQTIVNRFLAKWEGTDGTVVGASVPGVTDSDVSRWRAGHYKRLTTTKRRALLTDLKSGKNPPERDLYQEGVDSAVAKMRTLLDRLSPG